MSSGPIYQLAYVSRSAIVGSSEEVRSSLRQILTTSRVNNPRRGVTGALLFSDGCFAQILEGERVAIEEAFEVIERDERHRDVIILRVERVERRSFPQWAMGFAGLAGVSNDPDLVGTASPAELLANPASRPLIASLQEILLRDERLRSSAVTG